MRNRTALSLLAILLLSIPFILPGEGTLAALGINGDIPEAVSAEQPRDSTGLPGEVVVLELRGAVNSSTAEYLEQGLREAGKTGAQAVVLLLDTPGGLVKATLRILEILLESPVPVIVYVHPRGAIAASAGAFILTASHLAAMSPGTTVGAAMPVEMSPSEGGRTRAADQKTISFLAGHMRSVARERNRPENTAELFVTENLTLDAQEALQRNMIEFVAGDLEALLAAADGNMVKTAGREETLETAGAVTRSFRMGPVLRWKSFLADPTVALILLIGGALVLYLGAAAPGTGIPEIGGALALLLGIFGLGLFDSRTTGVILLALGLGLLVAEAFTPTFGILGLGGVLSLFLGAITLPAEPLLPGAWFRAFRITAAGAALAGGGLAVGVFAGVLRARRRRRRHTDSPFPEGTVATVVRPGSRGLVRVGGELWNARPTG
ncbi:MAG: hypothetical protein HYY09_08425, partial [Firmicutes bacterium]|nr:hypothetical protein [Bacillota bacterium]